MLSNNILVLDVFEALDTRMAIRNKNREGNHIVMLRFILNTLYFPKISC